MTWDIERTPKFLRSYEKLSSEIQKQCEDVIDTLRHSDNPRALGKPLSDKTYRYRFGGYRLIISPSQ